MITRKYLLLFIIFTFIIFLSIDLFNDIFHDDLKQIFD